MRMRRVILRKKPERMPRAILRKTPGRMRSPIPRLEPRVMYWEKAIPNLTLLWWIRMGRKLCLRSIQTKKSSEKRCRMWG